MQVKDLIRHMLETTFPKHSALLLKCKLPGDITTWRHTFCRDLNRTSAEGEVKIDQPQKESKKDKKKSFPKRLLQAACELDETQVAVQQELKEEDIELKESITEYNAFTKKTGKKTGKYDDMIQVFKYRSQDDILNSKQRIELNSALVKDAEAQVLSIFTARLEKVVASKTETIPSAKVVKTTLTDDCNGSNTDYNGDLYEYPAPNDLSFDRHIVGFSCNGTGWNGVIPIYSDGTRANLKQESDIDGNFWNDVYIPNGAEIRKVRMNGDSHEFGGVQLIDANGVMILQAGKQTIGGRKIEIFLQEGERLIGTKSFKY